MGSFGEREVGPNGRCRAGEWVFPAGGADELMPIGELTQGMGVTRMRVWGGVDSVVVLDDAGLDVF